MNKKVAFLVLLLVALSLRCRRTEAPLPSNESALPTPSAPAEDVVYLPEEASEIVGIRTEEVGNGQCKSVLKRMGKVLAPQTQTAIVSHAFPARVADIHIKLGDWVEQGQALITLDSQEVGSAKSEFYKAIAAAELAKLNLDREERLLSDGIGLKKNYVAAEAEYKVAQANLEAAEKTLHVLGFTEGQVKEITGAHQINPTITLYSPIAGKVTCIRAVLGALVDQATEILTIIDPTLLWVDAEAYETDIARLKIGQPVEIVVPAYPGDVFRGKVSYIGDIVDEETRKITVRAEVSNDQFRLKPGMFADVAILLNGDCQMLVVPSAAVLEEGRQKIVFVQEKDHFVRREVQTGVVDGERQEVVEGLVAGERVVIEGNHELKSELQEEVLQAAEVH
ncbi:MAG: efflux RND transporter periplasmic adaptor subunit [Pirellulales bacterium]|nr:efflux RND transporter periplasmic adaptor subunit [Pirellulales bacterium]